MATAAAKPSPSSSSSSSSLPLDAAVADDLRKVVYAFASFGSAEPRVDLDGKVRAALIGGSRARGWREGSSRAAHTRGGKRSTFRAPASASASPSNKKKKNPPKKPKI